MVKRIAELAGVGSETIRFYEREQLLPDPSRTQSGYRQYPLTAVRQIRFIKRAQMLGFSLSEIRELLTLTQIPESTAADIRARATEKIAAIDQKISSLQRMRDSLQKLTDECQGHGPLSTCPILEALGEDTAPESSLP